MDVLTRNRKSFAGSNLRNEGRRIAMKHFNNFKIVLNQMELFQQPLVNTFAGHSEYSLGCLKVLASGDLVTGYKTSIRIWDVRTSTCKQTWTAYYDYENVIYLDQLPSGELVTGSGAKRCKIKIWDLRTRHCVNTWTVGARETCKKVLPSGGLICVQPNGTVKIYDVKSGKCIKSLQLHGPSLVGSLELLPSGELVSGEGDGTIKIWDLQSQRCRNMLKHAADADDQYPASVTCLQALTSGELVSGSADCTIKVWDVKTGNCLNTLAGHINSVCGLQVLPSGDLASASLDNTIRIWDVETGECIRTLEHLRLVFGCPLHLLPSGELVSGSLDYTFKIWSIVNWKNIPQVFGYFH